MKTEGTLDDLYLEWLYTNFVGAVSNRNPERSFWELTKQLYHKKFTWVIPRDANRSEDGKELRRQFINECDIQDVEVNWLQIECSVLEMLIGLACRASFESFGEPGNWLWKFFENLGIEVYNDHYYNNDVVEEVDAIIQRLLDRTYEQNGVGGVFPCNNARTDQTQIELWTQLQGYLLEGNYLEHGP